jgi:hypothetical protein
MADEHHRHANRQIARWRYPLRVKLLIEFGLRPPVLGHKPGRYILGHLGQTNNQLRRILRVLVNGRGFATSQPYATSG